MPVGRVSGAAGAGRVPFLMYKTPIQRLSAVKRVVGLRDRAERVAARAYNDSFSLYGSGIVEFVELNASNTARLPPTPTNSSWAVAGRYTAADKCVPDFHA